MRLEYRLRRGVLHAYRPGRAAVWRRYFGKAWFAYGSWWVRVPRVWPGRLGPFASLTLSKAALEAES